MTTPQDITVSLESAKALKEAGYPQDETTYFMWRLHEDSGRWWIDNDDSEYSKYDSDIAAPTAAEILRELPMKAIKQEENTEKWFIEFGFSGNRYVYVCELYEPYLQKNKATFHADTLAEAFASMYIYLSKNNLL